MADVDVLIVGAGSTGAAAAAFLAEAGFEVLAVDRRAPREAGARWLNAVPPWCFEEAGLGRPRAPERWGGEGEHASVVAIAGGGPRVRIEAACTDHVDMRLLVARLQERAERAGARFERNRLVDVEREGDRVRAVKLADRRVRPALVVDASGLAGVVRQRVPALAAAGDPAPLDVCSASQHVHEVADREGARAFLARYGAAPGESISLLGVAGGYSTLSLFTEPDLAQVGVLTGTVPAAGAPSGLGLLERFVEAQPWIGARVFGGQAGIPIRRPYARLAAPGVALLGDAGCMVYASHGSGVGMGLIAARTLAEALRGAADPGSARALRRWERSWQRRWGGRLAGADAFRRFAQGLDREGVATLFGSGLLDPHLVEAGLRQQPPALDPAWLVRAAKRLAQRPDVARRMLPAVARSLALEPLLALAPVDQVEPVVERLVGPTPKTRARVHLP